MAVEEKSVAELERLIATLRDEIHQLNQRVAAIEKMKPAAAREAIQREKSPSDVSSRVQCNGAASEISDEVLMAIGAALAAYFGLKPHLRQIRLIGHHPWGLQGRVTIQASHALATHSS